MDHKLEYNPPREEEEKGKRRDRDEPRPVKAMPVGARGHGDDGTTGHAAPPDHESGGVWGGWGWGGGGGARGA